MKSFEIEIEFELGGANGVYVVAARSAKAAKIAVVDAAEEWELVAGVVSCRSI